MTATQFLELLASLSVQVAAVVIMTHWLGRTTNNERMQCRLWSLCYLVVLLLVAIAVLLPHPRLFQPWAGVAGDSATTLFHMGLRLGRVLFAVWLTGAAVSLLVFIFSWVQTFRFLKTCQPIDPALFRVDALAVRDSRQTEQLLAGKTLLLTSTRLATPFCWQLHRPYIVLPEYLLGFGEQELRFVIRHELAHLGNGHPLQLFLQRVVEILFWFHPMVWWASQQTDFAREFACDDAAIDSPTEIGAYLRSLLTIVECSTAQSQNAGGPLAFGAGKSLVSKRARRLVQIARNGAPRHRRRVPEVAISLALVGVAAAMAFVWLPADVLASPRSRWSPWPAWSSAVLHEFGVSARDFDVYYGPLEPYELQGHGQAVAPAAKGSKPEHP